MSNDGAMVIETKKIVKTALRTLQRLLRPIHMIKSTVDTHNSVLLLSRNNPNVTTHMARASCRHQATLTNHVLNLNGFHRARP